MRSLPRCRFMDDCPDIRKVGKATKNVNPIPPFPVKFRIRILYSRPHVSTTWNVTSRLKRLSNAGASVPSSSLVVSGLKALFV